MQPAVATSQPARRLQSYFLSHYEYGSVATDDDEVALHVLGCRVDILETNCDQCVCVVQCCFTSTDTIRLIRTATSTFTQLLNSMVLAEDRLSG